jgi:hypothetical protein
LDCAGATIYLTNYTAKSCLNVQPKFITGLHAGSSSEAIHGSVEFWDTSDPTHPMHVTDLSKSANDYYPFLEAEIGFGTTTLDPEKQWSWQAASWNTNYAPPKDSLSDEFTSNLGVPLAGSYIWGWRFRLSDALGINANKGPWTVCDNNGIAPPSSSSFATLTVVPTVISTVPTNPKRGSALRITGMGFTSGTTVTIGATAQTNPTVTSSLLLDISLVDASTPLGTQEMIITSTGQSATSTVTVE